MRKGRFSEAQIVAVLHEFDGGAPGEELARRHGMHANTIRLWRSKYAGMSANDLAQLKQYGIKRAAKIHSRRGSTAYETFARLNVRTLIIGLHSSRAETESYVPTLSGRWSTIQPLRLHTITAGSDGLPKTRRHDESACFV